MQRRPLQLATPLTFLVGENGSGKSTVVEAIAVAYGLDLVSGPGARPYAPQPRAHRPLAEVLRFHHTARGLKFRKAGSPGYFLRGETAHQVLDPGDAMPLSHGEGYLELLLGDDFAESGLYLLDEPESPLSFSSTLVLAQSLAGLVERGAQIICATHSPILCAVPGATILELDEHGFHERRWADLSMVSNWRHFLDDPNSFLW